MSYFKSFPKVAVDFHGDGDLVLLSDITKRVRFTDLAKKIILYLITMM